MLALHFGWYRKKVTALAKQATIVDVREYQGRIETLEGPVGVVRGDWIMKGIQGELWVIYPSIFPKLYDPIAIDGPDEQGFSVYQPIGVKKAVQVFEDFSMTDPQGLVLRGKAGDYLAINDTTVHVVARAIFEQSYQEVQGEQ